MDTEKSMSFFVIFFICINFYRYLSIKSVIMIFSLFIIVCLFYLIFTQQSNVVLVNKRATKIFYDFDEQNAKFDKIIYHIGNEDKNIMENFVGLYHSYIYGKKNNSNFFEDIGCNFTQKKIKDISNNVENIKKINESINKFKNDKEIKEYIMKNFNWEILDSDITYELFESIKLQSNNTIDRKNIDKYIYIDDGYYFDNSNLKKYEYNLNFIVKNDSNCDLIVISAHKNNNMYDVKIKINELENTVNELKKEIHDIKNKTIIQDKTNENQPENV